MNEMRSLEGYGPCNRRALDANASCGMRNWNVVWNTRVQHYRRYFRPWNQILMSDYFVVENVGRRHSVEFFIKFSFKLVTQPIERTPPQCVCFEKPDTKGKVSHQSYYTRYHTFIRKKQSAYRFLCLSFARLAAFLSFAAA